MNTDMITLQLQTGDCCEILCGLWNIARIEMRMQRWKNYLNILSIIRNIYVSMGDDDGIAAIDAIIDDLKKELY